MKVLDSIVTQAAQIAALRRDIHAHPELCFQEVRTADLVASKLTEWGIPIHRGLGTTGVVGIVKNGTSARAVGLRADMDALPMQEFNTFAHASRHAGKMHACGHDGHTAMLLAAAQYLATHRNFDGTVYLIFQPAEEGLGGAQAMIADGLFERFPCQSVFGMHNRPSLPVGKFAVRAGPMMAGGAFFDIKVKGKGAHGARPESGVDPVLVAAHIATMLQSIVSRNVPPVETAVLSVTRILGGDAYNVIPDSAHLGGTARAFSREVMAQVESGMKRIAKGVAEGMGASAEVDFRVLFAPTVNDAAEAEFAASICNELVGAENVNRNPQVAMGSEDFSFMLEKVPGCYLHIGNGGAEGGCEVHNPGYDFNDAALPLGAAFFARAVETKLARA